MAERREAENAIRWACDTWSPENGCEPINPSLLEQALIAILDYVDSRLEPEDDE